jgi:hypothetical protein
MSRVIDTRIAALEADIERWRQHDWMGSMSDDFWYTNGGHARAEAEIRKIERQLAELKAVQS